MPKEAFPLKIDKDTLTIIRSKASGENRSTNNYIETLLKEKVEELKKGEKKKES